VNDLCLTITDQRGERISTGSFSVTASGTAGCRAAVDSENSSRYGHPRRTPFYGVVMRSADILADGFDDDKAWLVDKHAGSG
jgi:hypothetical protein